MFKIGLNTAVNSQLKPACSVTQHKPMQSRARREVTVIHTFFLYKATPLSWLSILKSDFGSHHKSLQGKDDASTFLYRTNTFLEFKKQIKGFIKRQHTTQALQFPTKWQQELLHQALQSSRN